MKLLKNIFAFIFVSSFGLIIGLVVAEVIVRLIASKQTNLLAWNDRPEFYFRDEKAATLQDYHYANPKELNAFRIAIVGDSYSFAPYMQFTDTFAKKLETMLNLNDTVTKGEVINYGVPAYSTSHEIKLAERAVTEGADMIMIQITLNDPEIKPYMPKGIEIGAPDRFGRFEVVAKKKKIYDYWKTLEFVKSRLHNRKSYSDYTEYHNNLFNNPKTWGNFVKSLKAINEIGKNSNKKVVAVTFPLFGLPLDDNYPFKAVHEKISAEFAQQGIDCLDLFEAFKGLPIDRMQVIPGVDRHPNEIAHRIAAEKIYKWLEEKSFIPEDLKIRFKYSERMGITGKGLVGR